MAIIRKTGLLPLAPRWASKRPFIIKKRFMQRSIKYISIIILSVNTLLSCKKVIDLTPESAITAEGSLTNANAAQAAIIGCYDGLQSLPRNFLVWGEGRADVYGLSDLSTVESLQ